MNDCFAALCAACAERAGSSWSNLTGTADSISFAYGSLVSSIWVDKDMERNNQGENDQMPNDFGCGEWRSLRRRRRRSKKKKKCRKNTQFIDSRMKT